MLKYKAYKYAFEPISIISVYFLKVVSLCSSRVFVHIFSLSYKYLLSFLESGSFSPEHVELAFIHNFLVEVTENNSAAGLTLEVDKHVGGRTIGILFIFFGGSDGDFDGACLCSCFTGKIFEAFTGLDDFSGFRHNKVHFEGVARDYGEVVFGSNIFVEGFEDKLSESLCVEAGDSATVT